MINRDESVPPEGARRDLSDEAPTEADVLMARRLAKELRATSAGDMPALLRSCEKRELDALARVAQSWIRDHDGESSTQKQSHPSGSGRAQVVSGVLGDADKKRRQQKSTQQLRVDASLIATAEDQTKPVKLAAGSGKLAGLTSGSLTAVSEVPTGPMTAPTNADIEGMVPEFIEDFEASQILRDEDTWQGLGGHHRGDLAAWKACDITKKDR